MSVLNGEYVGSITALHEQYAAGAVTPELVMSSLIEKADRDRAYHIWIEPPSMERMRPYLENLGKMDVERKPLWGIPFAVKDNIDLAGVETTAACPAYAYLPAHSAVVVDRLIKAGAIPVGKTNLDQFATGLVGARSPYGETHNALRPELISGGSSSGSAVAVARGQAVFALGTDTAGSGRVPAALNGIVGFKPSVGAWPIKGVVPACASLDCVTVFTANIQDAILVDRIARGVDGADPWSRKLPDPAFDMPSKLLVPAGELTFYGPYAEQYRSAWVTCLASIEALGLPVERVDIGLFEEAAAVLYEGPWVAERWASLGEFVSANAERVHPVTARVLSSAVDRGYDAASVFKSMHKLQSLKLEAKRLLGSGVLVMPTCGGTWTREQVRLDPIRTNTAMGMYTNHCNLLDLCGLAVPAGDADARVPFGVTLFARSECEGLLFMLAARFGDRVQGR